MDKHRAQAMVSPGPWDRTEATASIPAALSLPSLCSHRLSSALADLWSPFLPSSAPGEGRLDLPCPAPEPGLGSLTVPPKLTQVPPSSLGPLPGALVHHPSSAGWPRGSRGLRHLPQKTGLWLKPQRTQNAHLKLLVPADRDYQVPGLEKKTL